MVVTHTEAGLYTIHKNGNMDYVTKQRSKLQSKTKLEK